MSELMTAFWQLPVIARTLSAATFVVSICAHTRLIPFLWLYFDAGLLFQIPPQVWRLVTTFLVTGPQISIILQPYFIYTYVSQMEVANPRFSTREDLLWYLMFVCSAIVAVNNLTGLCHPYLLDGLILALAYTSTQDQRGQKANFFFLTIPAQLVPYAMMFVGFLLAGPDNVLLQLCGLFAAHLYDFLSRLYPEFGGGTNILKTPAFVSRLLPATSRTQVRDYGTAIYGTGSSTGARPATQGSGPLPDAWRTRGRGQRLGGDP